MAGTETAEIVRAARMAVDISIRLKDSRLHEVSRANIFTFAESCTGGLAASAVTSVPGASSVFPGSFVTYSNRAKVELLSVAPETIAGYGAVSAECAAEMALGAMQVFDTVIAISVTGVAGPGGGSPGKPVGTVWFAAAHADGRVRLRRGYYGGRPRDGVRKRAVLTALRMLLDSLTYELK